MLKLEGLSASLGTVIAPAYFYKSSKVLEIPCYKIENSKIDSEWERFTKALETSKKELELLEKDSSGEQKNILQAHLMMLCDSSFVSQIKENLEKTLCNVEKALQTQVEEAVKMLRSTSDEYLAERAIDIEDAFSRVFSNLALQKTGSRANPVASRFVPPSTILVAKNLMPSEALALKDSGIVGIVLEEGGATSHVAILARSWQIPAVMGVRDAMENLSDGEKVILDAYEGLIISKPTKFTLNKYQERVNEEKQKEKSWQDNKTEIISAVCETKDKRKINLYANSSSLDETKQAIKEGAKGIGLFRSEFLFLDEDNFLTEEEQYKVYKDLAKSIKGKPIIIRTLDFGADKMVDEQKQLKEKNPLLGWRAVRYCLDKRDLFKTQIRAILKASLHGDIRIMFPMITNVEELDAVLDVLDESKKDLSKNKKKQFNPNIKIGIMIEVPAAAICADLLAQKIDFISIGTNDLIQYTMAVDRENAKVAHLYDCFNPAVLRLIKAIVDAGVSSKTEISVCGEMAGDLHAIIILIGLGINNFSMSPALVLKIKSLILKLSYKEAKELSDSALQLSAAREIRKLVQEKLKTYG